jgi:hypothetical protein
MNDTAPAMKARYRAMLMQRSGKERLMMGCAMRVTAKILQMAGQEVRGSAPLISGSNEATSMIRRAWFSTSLLVADGLSGESWTCCYYLLFRRVIIAPKPITIPRNTRSPAVNQPRTQVKSSPQLSNINCQNLIISVLAGLFKIIASTPWSSFLVTL